MISRLCQACQAHLSAPLPGVVSWALQGKKGHICSAKHFLSSLTFTSKNFWAFVGSVRGYLLQLCRWAQCLCGDNLVRILSPSLLSPLSSPHSIIWDHEQKVHTTNCHIQVQTLFVCWAPHTPMMTIWNWSNPTLSLAISLGFSFQIIKCNIVKCNKQM